MVLAKSSKKSDFGALSFAGLCQLCIGMFQHRDFGFQACNFVGSVEDGFFLGKRFELRSWWVAASTCHAVHGTKELGHEMER
jgi:hypothetical protein